MDEGVGLSRSLDLYQTPTSVIGPERVIVGERPIEHLRRAIDSELACPG